MKTLSFIYIFVLAIICSPGIFIKYKNLLLNAFIFAIVFFITFDFVNRNVENYQQYNIDVDGVNSLVDLIKTQNSPSKHIDVNNNLYHEESNDEEYCWTALGKNQRELELIKVQLDSYSGTNDSIDNLNNQREAQEIEISKLKEKLQEVQGTNSDIDQIRNQIKDYETEIDTLKQQIREYIKMNTTIDTINNQIFIIKNTINKLNKNITTCNDVNKEKEDNITNLTKLIPNQESKIKKLELKKTLLPSQIVAQKEKIASLEKTIKDKTGCPSPVYAIGTANVDPWYIGNKSNGDIFGQRSAYWIWWTSNARISAPSTGKHYVYYYNNPGDSYVTVYVTADNYFKLHVNENYIGEDGSWNIIQGYNIKLKTGRNKFDFYARNYGDNNPAGLIVVCVRPNGQTAFVSAPSTVDAGWLYY